MKHLLLLILGGLSWLASAQIQYGQILGEWHVCSDRDGKMELRRPNDAKCPTQWKEKNFTVVDRTTYEFGKGDTLTIEEENGSILNSDFVPDTVETKQETVDTTIDDHGRMHIKTSVMTYKQPIAMQSLGTALSFSMCSYWIDKKNHVLFVRTNPVQKYTVLSLDKDVLQLQEL